MNKEDYNKYYIQGSDHYLIPKDVFKELFNEMVNWKEEAKELKKQLEEYKKKLMIATKMEIKQIDEATFVGIDYFKDKCIMLKAQQKEFIKFLEDNWNTTQDIWYIKILQKYKEIIGDDK